MPSEYSPAGGDRDCPAWRRRLAADLGEDPGRFLELPGAEEQALQPDTLVRARIRGIDRLERVRAWQAYERRRAAERGTDPRDGIMRALAAAERAIHESGGRPAPETIRDEAERRREALRAVDLDAGDATFLDETGEEYERTPTYINSSGLVSPDESDSEAVTDGGEEVDR